MDYEEIAAALGVSKSSVSLWVRSLPLPARLSYAECRKRAAEGAHRYWATERPAREASRAAAREAAAAQIGPLTDRELLIAGTIAYWCEGRRASLTASRNG
jgi:transposase